MRNLRTEQEIMANWKGDLSKPVVSICCITYNHENYIEDALEGFLIQETEFPFEIVIHDDASTDKTASIIQEYVEKYPKIIKPILRLENQYSKKGASFITSVFEVCMGEYIALCEGDDYWEVPNKLQRQVNLIKTNSSFDLVVSKAKTYDEDCRIWGEVGVWHNRIVPIGKIIYSSGCIATATILIRASVVKKLTDFFQNNVMVADYFIQVLGAKSGGGALYLDDFTAVYRKNSTSSVTKGELSVLSKRLVFCKSMYSAYKELEKLVPGHGYYFCKRKIRFKIWNFIFFIKRNSLGNAFKVLFL